MSTLMSSSPSPAPAASPRSSFHVQRGSYHSSTYSPFPVPPSPKQRTPNAPQQAYQSPRTASGAGPKQPREPFHRAESAAVEKKLAGYVDEGTQYSPDGSPPTAVRGQAQDKGKERLLQSGPTAGSTDIRGQEQGKWKERVVQSESTAGSPARKRKERDGSHTPDPMSTSGSSSGSSAPAVRAVPPLEPNPRRDPTPAPSQTASQALRSEPQEARSTHGHSSAPKRSKASPGIAKAMPILYQNCDPKELGVLISSMLMELIRLNDQIPLRDGRLTRFHSRAPPGISVGNYLQRLIHHAKLSPPIILSMVWYIDRLCQLYPSFTINSLTVHRFLITAACVAAKGLSDSFWTNPTYAQIGGIPVTELATLELEFLQKVEWKIVPKPEVLVDYYRSLVERTEGYEVESSGETEGSSRRTSEDGDGKRDDDEAMTDEPT